MSGSHPRGGMVAVALKAHNSICFLGRENPRVSPSFVLPVVMAVVNIKAEDAVMPEMPEKQAVADRMASTIWPMPVASAFLLCF